MKAFRSIIRFTSAAVTAAALSATGCQPVEVTGDTFESSLELNLLGEGLDEMYGPMDFGFTIISNHSSLTVVEYDCEFNDESVIREGTTYDATRNDSKGYYYIFSIPDVDFDTNGEGVLRILVEDPATAVRKELSATFQKLKDYTRDFDLKESYEIEVGSEPVRQEITLTPVPATAVDGVISAVSSTVETVVKPSFDGAKLILECLKPGTAEITVTMGGVTKRSSVTVFGKKVMEFSLKESYVIPFGTDGGSLSDTLTYFPSTALDGSVTQYMSADESIVRLSVSGNVLKMQAMGLGQTTIDVTMGECKRSAVVTVEGIYVTDFDLAEQYSYEYSSEGGKTYHYDLTYTPANALNGSIISAVSSDEKVAKVSGVGTGLDITTVGPGSCEVEVSMGTARKTAAVTVGGIYVTDFKLDSEYGIVIDKDGVGRKTIALSPVPSNAIDAVIGSVSSSDEGVATISSSGLNVIIDGVSTGSSQLSVTLGGVTKTTTVNVTEKVRSFDLPERYELEVGINPQKYTFPLTYTPAAAINGGIGGVASSDVDIVRASANGMALELEAVNPGTAIVDVTVGEITRYVTVEVTGIMVRDFGLKESYTQPVATSNVYDLTFTPSTAKDAVISSAVSSDESVLKVTHGNRFIRVETVYPGTASVKVKMGSVEKSAEFTVTGSAATGIDADGLNDLGLAVGGSATKTLTVTPSDAFDKNTLTVTSSDPSVVSVEMEMSGDVPTGRVFLKGKSTGKAVLKASAGRYSTTYDVYCESVALASSVPSALAWGGSAAVKVKVTSYPLDGKTFYTAACTDDSNISVSVSGDEITITNNTHGSSGTRTLVLTTAHGVSASSVFSVKESSGKFTPSIFIDSETCVPTGGSGRNPIQFEVAYTFENQSNATVTLSDIELLLVTRSFCEYYGSDANRALLDLAYSSTWSDHLVAGDILVRHEDSSTEDTSDLYSSVGNDSEWFPTSVEPFSTVKGTLIFEFSGSKEMTATTFQYQPQVRWKLTDSRNGKMKNF